MAAESKGKWADSNSDDLSSSDGDDKVNTCFTAKKEYEINQDKNIVDDDVDDINNDVDDESNNEDDVNKNIIEEYNTVDDIDNDVDDQYMKDILNDLYPNIQNSSSEDPVDDDKTLYKLLDDSKQPFYEGS
ncbi:coiled-coil domain-containing protein 1-like [Impatiens glandulifera]|uniref:coiled-coil domain-containing protein 1-like n=1 Tax=Impatiens glandulifera TaxID=253017 RepID=UPI001FB0793D|nr:coiled-coil domain-containing protein 1-like [Impatiens glandulifera]